MRLLRLDDIITGIIVELVKDGDVFEAESNGDRLIYKDGVLAWLTIGGYVSNPVTVTSENIDERYKRVEKETSRVEGKLIKQYVDCGKKLSEVEVYSIHHYYYILNVNVSDIAIKFGVSERMVYYILDGVHWKEVHEKFTEDYRRFTQGS